MQFNVQDIEGYDGNILMCASKMEDFIRLATAHSATCGKQLVLVERNTNNGAHVQHTWKCPCCGDELTMSNCDMVRSSEVALGASYSRSQPDFNLRIPKGARLVGINVEKVEEFMSGHMGIKIPNDNNLRKQMTKVHASIHHTYKEREEENRREHVEAVREEEEYCGDIAWGSADGEMHSTARGDLSMDGAGATRIYNNRSRGKQSAHITNSKRTGKPLNLEVSQVSVHIV